MTATADRAALLSTLSTAVWVGVTARDNAIAALRACESDDEQSDVREIVLRTYMARRLNPGAKNPTQKMLDAAGRVLACVGANSTTETANKRTPEQEKMYGGAREYLRSLRAAAQVKAPAGSGGANNPNGSRAPRTPDGADETPIAPPEKATKIVIETGLDMHKHGQHVAATLMAFTEKHAAIATPEWRKAINAFSKAMKALPTEPAA
jgi:hypothetical protein